MNNYIKMGVNALVNFLGKDTSGTVMLGDIALPVPPETFEMSVTTNNDVVKIQSAGELNLIGTTGLKTISIASFLPAVDYPFAAAVDCYSIVEQIEALRTAKKPTHFTIIGTNIDMDILINSFTYGEKDFTQDIYFTLELKEYRELETATDLINQVTGLKEKKSWLENVASNISLKKGDSLFDSLTTAIQKATPVQKGKFDTISAFKTITKKGIKAGVGDIISVEAGKISVNDNSIIYDGVSTIWNGDNNKKDNTDKTESK